METTTNNVLIKKQEMIDVKPSGTFGKGFMMAWKIYSEYEEHWMKMKEIVKSHNLHLMDHGTIIAVNELKNLNHIDEIVGLAKEIPEIKDFARNGIDSTNGMTFKKELEKRMFTTFMRVFYEYCRQNSCKEFTAFIQNKKNLPLIKEMFNTHGTILQTEKNIEEIVGKILNKQ